MPLFGVTWFPTAALLWFGGVGPSKPASRAWQIAEETVESVDAAAAENFNAYAAR